MSRLLMWVIGSCGIESVFFLKVHFARRSFLKKKISSYEVKQNEWGLPWLLKAPFHGWEKRQKVCNSLPLAFQYKNIEVEKYSSWKWFELIMWDVFFSCIFHFGSIHPFSGFLLPLSILLFFSFVPFPFLPIVVWFGLVAFFYVRRYWRDSDKLAKPFSFVWFHWR